ncbi:MAG: virulence factor [Hyphomicrobiaceae bacterium]
MPQKIIVYWRDIPAQVIIKAGRKNAKRQLPERFEQAIDMAAMRSGAAGTDDYLADWRRADPEDIEGDDLEALANAEAERLTADYDKDRVKALIDNGGRATE